MVVLVTSDLTVVVLSAALTAAAYLGRRFMLGLIRWKRGREALERLGQHPRRAVMATHAEYVSAIRARRADGVLTKDEREHAKRGRGDGLTFFAVG